MSATEKAAKDLPKNLARAVNTAARRAQAQKKNNGTS